MVAKNFMQSEEQKPEALVWLEDMSVFAAESSKDWIEALRETAKEQFAQSGLPNPAWEGWKHINLRGLNNFKFKYSIEPVKFDAKKIPAKLLEDSYRVVLVNGQYQENLSDLPEELELKLLSAADENETEYLVTLGDLADNPFKALNSAYMRDGLILKTQQAANIEKPIEVLFYNLGCTDSPSAIYPRMLYWLSENSNLTLIERHAGEGVYLSNSYACINLEKSANCRFYKFEDESLEAFHFSQVFAQQDKESFFECFAFASGGLVAREEYKNQLIAPETFSSIGGLYLLRGNQNHDFTILTEHFEPNCKSVQKFKGVADDKANAVFQGKIYVYRQAQKTDASQINRTLLLSKDAKASFKPELEIYADDVKCSHGATSGEIDSNALFYLQSRGIPYAEAKSLLVQAFLSQSLGDISYEPIKDVCLDRVEKWLKK